MQSSLVEEDRRPVERLFRTEALQAYACRHGSPVRPVGVASWLLAGFMLATLIAVATFLSVTKFARKETVPGVLEASAGATKIVALKSGVVARVFAKDGDRLVKGQPIAAISVDSTLEGGASLHALYDQAAREQADAIERQAEGRRQELRERAADIAIRRASLDRQLTNNAEKLDLQTQVLASREESLKSYRELLSKGVIGAIAFRQQEESLMAARQNLASLLGEKTQIEGSLGQLDAEARRLDAQSTQSDAQDAATKAQLLEKRAGLAAQNQLLIVAEGEGRLTAFQARAGSTIAAGSSLGVILPDGATLEAQLWAPSRAAGFVRPGDRVRLMYDAFPYQKFGVGLGQVIEVARAPTAPQDLPTPMETRESLYRVRVQLDRQSVPAFDRQWSLTPGMRLTADMVLDRRSLLSWMMEPVLAARQRSKDASKPQVAK